MLEYITAALLPFLLMLLFNRVLFSKYVPLGITVLILIFGLDGFHQPVPLQIIGGLSTLIGFLLGLKIYRKQARKVKLK
jgi:general stress protein CsbA